MNSFPISIGKDGIINLGDIMFDRPKYTEKLRDYKDTEFIKVITGVRRSGKSFLMRLHKNYILESTSEKNVIYINFEHPDYYTLRDFQSLYTYLKEVIKQNGVEDEKIYFMFDEIQMVTEWESLINGLRVAYEDCDIYITGSNANLLAGELGTLLTGRYVEIPLYPLSFKELIDLKGADTQQKRELVFEEYLTYGGFPSVVLIEEENIKKDVLKGIYSSIVERDIISRGKINNPDLLRKVTLYLMDNIGNSVSSTKISGFVTSSGTKVSSDTISKYLSLLEESFVFYQAQRYDLRGKQRLRTLGKYYTVDVGLRNTILGRNDINRGSQIENLVYLKLKQDGYDVFVGKYDEKEIDFVCFKEDKVKHIQVTLQIPENSNRETDNLLLSKENVDRILVTADYNDVGIKDGIDVVHIIDFLLK